MREELVRLAPSGREFHWSLWRGGWKGRRWYGTLQSQIPMTDADVGEAFLTITTGYGPTTLRLGRDRCAGMARVEQDWFGEAGR